jgi:serine/threonine protein kinase
VSFVCPECARGFPAAGFCTEHGAPLGDSSQDDLLGQQVGSHRIARLVGRGGMGEVYLGVHPEIGSRVAIKLLALQAAFSKTLVDRFFAEARAVNLIRHEGIVNVIDLAHLSNGRPYIMMEYLEGAPLSDVLERMRPVPLGGFSQLMLGVLDALGAAHAQGITHRDLKPDNVFVTSAGRPKLLDFGVAKLRPEVGQLSDQTRTGALLGTPFYMSPEQARGQAVDQRADLYSLGVILYEGVTGRRPFSADNLYDLLKQQIEEIPARPSALRSELPPAFEMLILRALEKDPARRFQSAAEMSAALLEAARFLPAESFTPLVGQPGMGGPPRVAAPSPALAPTSPGLSRTVAQPPRRSLAPLWIGLGAVALLGLLGLTAAGGLFLYSQRQSEAGPPPSERPTPPPTSAAEEDRSPVEVDLRNPDVRAFLPRAQKLARERFPDAELQSIAVAGARADGSLNLDAEEDRHVSYTFRSPSAAKDQPMGACLVWVMLNGGIPQVSVPPFGSCMMSSVRPPRCTIAEVVKRARMHGDTVLITYGPSPYWGVLDDSSGETRTFSDDC